MAAIAWSDVTDLSVALSVVTAGWQTTILDYVNVDLNPDIYGGVDSPRYRLARIYLAAHMGIVWKTKGEVFGAVSSESVGADSITLSYGRVSELAGSLDSTSYGKEFMRITAGTRARFPMTW